jgi:uncharacterized protein DUF3292
MSNTNRHTFNNSATERFIESPTFAMGGSNEKGAAQVRHDEDVLDLGWSENQDDICPPLIAGMSNGDVWLLIRRFNKVDLYIPYLRIDTNSILANITSQGDIWDFKWYSRPSYGKRKGVITK